MTVTEMANKLHELANNWEQFKSINDRRLQEIESKGSSDSLTEMHLKRIGDNIDKYRQSLNKIETVLSRPQTELKAEYENIDIKEHSEAFSGYLRKGIENGLLDIEQKQMRLSERNSGYLITNRMAVKISASLRERSAMRRVASIAEISSSSLEVIADALETNAGWTQDNKPLEESHIPPIIKMTIPIHELYAQPKLTQRLLDDTAIDLEDWLANKIIDSFTVKENEAFISGDGIGKPRGILTYPEGKEHEKIEQIASGTSAKVTSDGIIRLFFSLSEKYADGAKFLMSRDAIQAVRMMKDTTTGRYLWQPGLEMKAPDTILGAEVVESYEMPGLSAGSLSIAFGNFKHAYQIADRQDIRILRDPFTHKPFVKFYTTKRLGGGVINFSAIKLMKLTS